MIKSILYSLLLAISVVSTSVMANGLTLNGTRLIYDAKKKEASMTLNNRGNSPPQLIQSWVSDKNKGTNDVPFLTTPPILKLSQNTTTVIRIVYIGDNSTIPDDRESLWLLNVRAIPAIEKKEHSTRLLIATQNIIKLIYRPFGLTSTGAEKAGENLVLSAELEGIRFVNPTMYVVTLAEVTINGQEIVRPGIIEPKGNLIIPFKGRPERVTWRTINDFGGLTKESHFHF